MKQQKKRKIFRKIIQFCMLCGFFFALSTFAYSFIITRNLTLDTNALASSSMISSLKILDSDENEITSDAVQNDYIAIDKIKPHTLDAFITSEDRNFFQHNGIDYKRIAGAMIANLKNRSIKQGGSTISQQLIKNTHLSHEKTFSRKIKEFKLTKDLEKHYSKNKILELYLNSIYFGNSAYGIENASKLYFDKSAQKLTLAESALLAGIISSPANNEPFFHIEKSTTKKELILKNMQKLGKINEKQLQNALNEKIKVSKKTKKSSNQFVISTINQACKILKINRSQLKGKQLTIKTNYSKQTQNITNSLITNLKSKLTEPDIQVIILDNKTKTVITHATTTNKNLENMKRQPGSIIKPIMVYAPAFEAKKITPESLILDEKTNFGNYSPQNPNGKYYGWIDTKTAISKSLNIPAVKSLNYVGIKNAKSFASNLGISFDKNDNHLALALGGFSKGTTAKEIADAYSCFATNGNFSVSNHITQISDQNGKILYEFSPQNKKTMQRQTARMITDCLVDAVKNGTAKKLDIDGIYVASKTGTTNQNRDAWNASYTTNYTIVTWIGNLNNTPLSNNINGASYPSILSREILKYLYKNKTSEDFQSSNNATNQDLSISDETKKEEINSISSESLNINF